MSELEEMRENYRVALDALEMMTNERNRALMQLSACAAGPWEPIAGAPMDGTECLLKDMGGSVFFGYFVNDNWKTDTGIVIQTPLTHFSKINMGGA